MNKRITVIFLPIIVLVTSFLFVETVFATTRTKINNVKDYPSQSDGQKESCPNNCSGHCLCSFVDPGNGSARTSILYKERKGAVLWAIEHIEGGYEDVNIYTITAYLDVDLLQDSVADKCKVYGIEQSEDSRVNLSKDRLEFGATCVFVAEERNYCCCAETTSGFETKNYKCVQDRAETGKEKCNAPNEVKEMPDSGGCTALELRGNVTLPAKKEGLGVSPMLFTTAKTELNPMNFTSVTGLVGRLIYVLLSVIGSIALVLYIYAGVLWMTAAGTAERITTAKNILIWTSLGVVVTLSSYIIVNYVFGILK